MNNFKKFAAVLLGVVMACVFATSAFAADFNKPNNAKRAREEILSFAASYGVTTIDNTVNKLTADQLNVIYANMDSLKAVAANAVNTIKGTTDANVALKAANDAVASMNSMLSAAGIVISNPALDTSDSSQNQRLREQLAGHHAQRRGHKGRQHIQPDRDEALAAVHRHIDIDLVERLAPDPVHEVVERRLDLDAADSGGDRGGRGLQQRDAHDPAGPVLLGSRGSAARPGSDVVTTPTSVSMPELRWNRMSSRFKIRMGERQQHRVDRGHCDRK